MFDSIGLIMCIFFPVTSRYTALTPSSESVRQTIPTEQSTVSERF